MPTIEEEFRQSTKAANELTSNGGQIRAAVVDGPRRPKYARSKEAYYDRDNDTVFAPDTTGEFYHHESPEEVGARVAASKMMLNKAGITSVDDNFLNEARKNETLYGDNFRDLLHMYNNENLIGIFNAAGYGK